MLCTFGQTSTMATNEPAWYGVRTIVRFPVPPSTYEERITLWWATSLDDAMVQAEEEGLVYCDELDGEWCGLVQAFLIGTEPIESGSEVFSLMRNSDLGPDEYLDIHFDTGTERQQIARDT